jgi:heme/copper-type cytochrome/quinol oxidase subunit 4
LVALAPFLVSFFVLIVVVSLWKGWWVVKPGKYSSKISISITFLFCCWFVVLLLFSFLFLKALAVGKLLIVGG